MRQRGRAVYQVKKRQGVPVLARGTPCLFRNRPIMRKKQFAKQISGIRMIAGLRERSVAIRGYYHKVERSAAHSFGIFLQKYLKKTKN